MSIKSKLDLIINNSTNHTSDIINNQLMNNLTMEDIKYFLEFNRDNRTLSSSIMNICSWEVFESIYNIALTEKPFDNSELQLLYSMIYLLIINNKVREVYIIIIEKLTYQHVTKNSFSILIYSLFLTMTHCNYDHYIWKNSLYLILKKLINIRKSHKPIVDSDNDSTFSNDHDQLKEYNEIDCYFNIVIHWMKKCIIQIIKDNDDNNDKQFIHIDRDKVKNIMQISDLMIGFLLNFIVKCILPHTNVDQWTQHYGYIMIEQISKLLHGDIMYLFDEIYRVQYDIFMQERYISLKKYKEVYHNRFSSRSITSTHGWLSTEDNNALLSRIAQSEYSTLLIQYYNSITLGQQSHDPSIRNVPWISCIPWKYLLDYKKDREKDPETGEVGLKHDPELCWHLKGIAILAKLLLSYILDNSNTSITSLAHTLTTTLFDPEASTCAKEINLIVPMVYQPSYLQSLLYPYIYLLLSNNLNNNQIRKRDRINISQQGLEFLILLKLPGCDKSNATLCNGYSIKNKYISNNECSSIFMPFLLHSDTQGNPSKSSSSSDSICAMNMSHIWLSFYSALPIISNTENVLARIPTIKNITRDLFTTDSIRRQSFWSSAEAAIVASISACSHDALFLTQSFINTMAVCDNSQLRTQAFQTLREILKGFEERSLFGLLSALISHCPYSNIAGLLIDIVRECAQIASRNHTVEAISWCAVNYTIPKITFGANNSNIYTTTTSTNLSDVPFWLYECIYYQDDQTIKPDESDTKKIHFPHEKLFKPTYNIHTQGVESATVVIDIDDIVLIPTSRYDPPSKYIDDQHFVPDKYIDLKANMKDFVSPEKYLELNEAGSFIWHGNSSFWSPLVISTFAIKPIQEALLLKTSEQILTKIDIISATVNLIKFIVLKLRADNIKIDNNTPFTSASMAINSYFSGTTLPKQYHLHDDQSSYIHNQYLVAHIYPYTFNKLHSIRELYQVYHMICQLKTNIHNIIHIDIQEHCLGGVVKMDQLRIELLYENIFHLCTEYKILCKDIYSLLTACL